MFEQQLRAGRDAPSYVRSTTNSVLVSVPLGTADLWGSMPKQYGRRWSDDSGEDVPPAPVELPDALDKYAHHRILPALVDLEEMRTASAAGGVDAFIDAVSGVDLVPAVQQVAVAALSLHRSAPPARRHDLFGIIASLLHRAQDRGWEGDDLLSEELLATLQDSAEESPLRAVPVDLDELAVVMTDSMGGCEHEGGYLNTRTGEAISSVLTDAAYVGEDVAIDVDDDPDWVRIAPAGSRVGWGDRARGLSPAQPPRGRGGSRPPRLMSDRSSSRPLASSGRGPRE